jgi:replicative DNA helicase
MNRALAQHSLEEREALDRVLLKFPDTKVREPQPHEAKSSHLGPPPGSPPQLVDGLTFALGAAGEEQAIWGTGDDVAWAPGEPTLIIGPDGVGKTTLGHRLTLCLAGIDDELLGLRVEPAAGRVLYVAADRPKQAARSLWRMLPDLDRRQHGQLKNVVSVWMGVPPFDLVKRPADLATWATDLGASHIILDSLGFIFGRLIEDETGSAIAQAFTIASTAGVEILALGHPRKASGENRKPNAIADVYGSRWITAAAGSVLSLWANPGDPVVELKHLKSPAGEVGPFLVELDPARGTMAMVSGSDLLGHLRSTSSGLSAKEAARFMEGATEKAREVKARRRLESLVARRLAFKREGEPIRGRVHEPDRYFAMPLPGLEDAPK